MTENKVKVPVHVTPEMRDEIDKALGLANATSRSDFCREAIAFYLGYLNQSKSVNYLSPLLVSAMKSEIRSSTKFICETLFKLAVESAMQSHIIAAVNDVDDETIDDLRGMCVDEVAHINGVINFERAYDYQKGSDDDE